MQSTSITRAMFDRLRLADEPLPKADVLIEPDGRRVDLLLLPVDYVQRTNPRIQSKEVRDALTELADLTEHWSVGAVQKFGPTPLGNLIDGGEAYQIEHDEKLLELSSAALAQLERWLATPAAAKNKTARNALRQRVEACVALLRGKGF